MPASPLPAEAILWLDEALLIIAKPAGLPTLPDGYRPENLHVRGLLEPDFGRLWIVHRLDKDTSGVLVLARSAAAHRALNTQFEQQQTQKRYHALVWGRPDWSETTVRLPLRVDGDRRHRTVVDAQRGKPAHTDLQVLESFVAFTLLEATLHTGRTHQIRAHLNAIGLPIVNDLLYDRAFSTRSARPAGIERLALHARELRLWHPLSGEALQIIAPYPPDFTALLNGLRAGNTP